MEIHLPLFHALKDLVTKHNRIAVCGWPNVGKTTAVRQLECQHVKLHSDSWNTGSFDQDWQRAIREVQQYDIFIVEGVGVGRMLEQGLVVDHIVFAYSESEPMPHHRGLANAASTVISRIGQPIQMVCNEIIGIQ